MHPSRLPVGAGLALVVLLGLTACGSGAASPAGSDSSAAPSSATPSSSTGVDAAGEAVCALVPAPQLAAAIGADPGAGTPAKGRIDGGQCTWKVSDTHSAIAQYTRDPDAFLPEGVYLRPKSASDVAGADRGFAAAESHTILIVKDGRGLLFTDLALADAKQSDYDALAAAIAARM